jgi:uncharacterized membrane protein
VFDAAALKRIADAIAAGERTHRGQVRFAVEPALPLARVAAGMTPRERALEVFSLSRTWDTEENCGVLLYLLFADRDVEIVADRGIHARVGDSAWEAICTAMEEAFRAGRFADGVESGLSEINRLLGEHFPRATPGTNELPDEPIML